KFVLPPFAHVEDAMESHLVVRQLGFVDDQARVGETDLNALEDLVERYYYGLEIGLKDFEREIRGCERPGNRDPFSFDFIGLHRMSGHDHRAIPIANARSTCHEDVLIRDI